MFNFKSSSFSRFGTVPRAPSIMGATWYLNPGYISGDLRQGSSNNSATNFVLGFSYIFQIETQPSFEDLLLVVLVILRGRFTTRF